MAVTSPCFLSTRTTGWTLAAVRAILLTILGDDAGAEASSEDRRNLRSQSLRAHRAADASLPTAPPWGQDSPQEFDLSGLDGSLFGDLLGGASSPWHFRDAADALGDATEWGDIDGSLSQRSSSPPSTAAHRKALQAFTTRLSANWAPGSLPEPLLRAARATLPRPDVGQGRGSAPSCALAMARAPRPRRRARRHTAARRAQQR